MSQRDAVQTATARMNKYCGPGPQCQPLRLMHAEKTKDRWMVEFDTPAKAFAVMVDRDANTQISIWDKSRDANGR